MTKESLQLVGYDDAPSLTVKYHSRNRLPMATLVGRGTQSTKQPVVMSASRPRSWTSGPQLPTTPQHCVTSPTNVNLSEPEKELLRWHQRLGHISFRRVQWLMRQGLLSSSTRTRSLHSTAKIIYGKVSGFSTSSYHSESSTCDKFVARITITLGCHLRP